MSTRDEIYEAVQAAISPVLDGQSYQLRVGTESPWTYTVCLTWRTGNTRLGLSRSISVEELIRVRDYHETIRYWARGISLAVEDQLRMAAVAGEDFD